MQIKPFQIDVSQDALDDVRDRLVRARVPHASPGAGWGLGVDAGFTEAR